MYIPRISFWIEKKPIYNKLEKHLIEQIKSVVYHGNIIAPNIARLIYHHPHHQEFIMDYVCNALNWNTDKAIIVGDINSDLKELEKNNPKKIRIEQ